MISGAVLGLIAQRRTTAPRVALTVGIGRTTFFNKLNTAAPWKAHEVDRLARHFGVSRDSLYEGRADFRAPTSDYGSEGWGFESLRARPRHPHRRRADRHRRQTSVVPLYLVTDNPLAGDRRASA